MSEHHLAAARQPTVSSHDVHAELCRADTALSRAMDAWSARAFSDDAAAAGNDLLAARLLIATAMQSTGATLVERETAGTMPPIPETRTGGEGHRP